MIEASFASTLDRTTKKGHLNDFRIYKVFREVHASRKMFEFTVPYLHRQEGAVCCGGSRSLHAAERAGQHGYGDRLGARGARTMPARLRAIVAYS